MRGILFDKIPTANWKVPFHEDVTIAVQKKVEVEGFGPWSVKAGVLHTQPPVSVLESMVALRLHLDECSQMNGLYPYYRGHIDLAASARLRLNQFVEGVRSIYAKWKQMAHC